ncbi:L-rhamnose mutarotase [Saccharobesus litoralis]|uniref:L-rhamnose mutarotase n=2 Tax=Saccharobesus litoralis TaxID=2172099 RepID=A0A2S0VN33_9ALTE|nr:L-rhamnose mutarotase [Saccharobesus litoralis]
MKKLLILTFLVLLGAQALAFSPYENRMRFEDRQRIGLIAFVKPSQTQKLQSLVSKVSQHDAKLSQQGIFNLSMYVREVNNRAVVFAYFESLDKSIQGKEALLANASPELANLTKYLTPHKRAAKGQVWLRMEWMNLIASTEVFPHTQPNVQKMGLMSGLKPELELQYRQLHQANWPGVVDGMVNSNYRNWTTFLIELEGELYLFTYTEYIGENIKKDNAKMAKDPTTQRWWQHTEQCLINLHGEGNWSQMTQITTPITTSGLEGKK